jgi:predicted short-subunit dehydrogenase-like oxidoreductase (DUF2520 family)
VIEKTTARISSGSMAVTPDGTDLRTPHDLTSRPVSLMRELERESAADDPALCPFLGQHPRTLAIVGRGRLGSTLASCLGGTPLELAGASWRITGPHGRGYTGTDADAVLLCVPDREIASAASLIPIGPFVGHCSGACRLDVLEPHNAFSVHPLMTVVPGHTSFDGAGAAVAASTSRALAFAASVARALGMRPLAISDEDRAVYHAAASIASNFLVTLEAAAERVAATAGIERQLLGPLVRATVENWIALGGQGALTGPVARGDEETVAAQRAAILEHAAELQPLFDALIEATRSLAGQAASQAVHPTRESGEPSKGGRDLAPTPAEAAA